MPTHASKTAAAQTRRGFRGAWEALVGAWTPTIPRRRGRKPEVPPEDLLAALTYHALQPGGTLGQHFGQLFTRSFADSSWSDRRVRLPWDVFIDLMRHVLRPRATRRQHPSAFWSDLRLLALDGTQFSLRNAPAIRQATRKARTRRGLAAFAKMTVAVLLELGTHNPIAAAIGRASESEWALGQRLLTQIPPRALLLADRLYGVPVVMAAALDACEAVGSHLLWRARRPPRSRIDRRLPDGSALVTLHVSRKTRSPYAGRRLTVREIRATIRRRGNRRQVLRLWTTLLDPQQASAADLVALYTRRWEHELYFRELKRDLRRTALLQSQTVDTAAQEIAAIVLASALLATERAAVSAGHGPPRRLSFPALLHLVQPMWLVVQLGHGVLTDAQVQVMLRRGYQQLRQCLIPERPSRSYPRAVRQPLQHWPRALDATPSPIPHVTVLKRW